MSEETVERECRALTQRLEERQAMPVEGSSSESQRQFLAEMIVRAPGIRLVGEIGFNGGYSCVAFLQARPDVRVVSFDLGRYSCVSAAKEFVDERYPGRHDLVLGDSNQTVREYEPAETFDFFFVDGGHSYEIARADLSNVRRLCRKCAMLVLDDLTPWFYWGEGPTRVWQEAVASGEIFPYGIYGDAQNTYVETTLAADSRGPDHVWGAFRFSDS